MSRVAVVTGGASGMGLAICQHLAANGNSVAVLDLSAEAAERAAAELRATGGKAVGITADVSDRAAVEAALDVARGELGPIEIMVTSAGFDTFTSFLDITMELWQKMLAVNLTGTFNCLQPVIPDMLAGGWGRIVTISSSSAQSGAKRMAHYVASKGGVIGLTKALALEYAPHGITVNTIPPGFIDTPMSRGAEARGDLPDMDLIAKQTPVRRAGTGDDIAAACTFLCSEEAGYITGQALNVNGGWYLWSTPRIPPLTRDQWDEAAESALRAGMRPEDNEKFFSDSPDVLRMPNALATMVHHPAVAKPFLAFNGVLLRGGLLTPRLRELMVLRVAWRTRSEYEWVQHARLAHRYEISPDDVAAIAEGTGSWTPLEADLIAATDELLDNHTITDATWQRLAAALTEAELVEVVFVVGTYTSLAMLLNSVGVELDPELDPSIAPAIED